MTTQEVAQMIESVGLPFAYDHFTKKNTPGGPPFICFLYPESENMFADDSVYQKIKRLYIELYTDRKDLEKEEAVENALDTAGLCYESSETYLKDEEMHMVRWETTVTITKEGGN